MKFLLDENISNSLYKYLKNQGFNVKKIGIEEPSGISDYQVIQIALNENRILITRDCGDIGKFIYKNNIKIKGVICIKGKIRGKAEVLSFQFVNKKINSFSGNFLVIDLISNRFELRMRLL